MGLALSRDGAALFVTTGRGGELVRLDAKTLRRDAAVAGGERPWGVTLTPDGRYLFTANGPSNDVTMVDARTMQVVARIASGGKPWGVVAR